MHSILHYLYGIVSTFKALIILLAVLFEYVVHYIELRYTNLRVDIVTTYFLTIHIVVVVVTHLPNTNISYYLTGIQYTKLT